MTTDCVGGVWTYSMELCRGLGEHGVEVILATMGPPPAAWQRDAVADLDNLRLVESQYRLEWMADPWSDLRDAGRWLLDLERRHRPDVIHLNGYAHGALAWQAPVMVVAHSCVLSWWEAVKGEAAPSQWDRYRAEVRQGLRAAEVVVAPSEAMLDAVSRHYGPLRRQAVISNGRDGRLFWSGSKEELIVSAGRFWDEAKNLAALRAIADRLPWPVCVAGDGAPGERTGGMRPLGTLEPQALAQWLSRASIYVSPARYEPFGLSALEAALSGCALVLGDIPSLREVWGDAALFVHPDDTRGLEAAVSELIEFPLRLEDWAERAFRRATRYSPQRMARGYLGLYQELAQFAPAELAAQPSLAHAQVQPV